MWLVVDHRTGTSKLHFAETEAKRDVRRIFQRNATIVVEEHEKTSAKTLRYDVVEEHKGNQASEACLPPRTMFEGDDFDLPFTERQWGELFDDANDLTTGPQMTQDEYDHGVEPENDDVGLSAFSDDEDEEEALL